MPNSDLDPDLATQRIRMQIRIRNPKPLFNSVVVAMERYNLDLYSTFQFNAELDPAQDPSFISVSDPRRCFSDSDPTFQIILE